MSCNVLEYGFKSNFLPANNNNPQPHYPSLPPESSPCSNTTNFRPIHPLNEQRKGN